MKILANQGHVRLVQFLNAFRAQPELHPFMAAALLHKIEAQVQRLVPLLDAAAAATDQDVSAMGEVEAVFDRAHDLVVRLLEGIRYRYHATSSGLAALAPLRVGRTPDEDEIRLATFIDKLPGMEPPFLWLDDEAFTLAACKKALKEHREAKKKLAALGEGGEKIQQALEALRKARPDTAEIWDENGDRLDTWISMHVPPAQQFAFGRERRKKPRGAGEPPTTTTKPPDAK